jgi:hypothetical protein
MIRINSVVCAATAAVGVLAGGAGAAIVPITSNSSLSTEGLGAFTGTLDYSFLGGTTGKLDVTLTNTTAAATGGYITAFMFRPPEELGAFGCTLTASDFAAMTNIPAGASGSPFPGSWIGGAGTGGSWLAGGAPGGGIGVGQTGTFSFTITGANASLLTSDSFVSGDLVSDPYAFIVRFRGMNDGGSDKVPAYELPAPGALALLGAVGMCGGFRRRRD